MNTDFWDQVITDKLEEEITIQKRDFSKSQSNNLKSQWVSKAKSPTNQPKQSQPPEEGKIVISDDEE